MPNPPSDGICPQCRQRPRGRRASGGLRGWCGACESAQKIEYMKTPAGRQTFRRWYVKKRGLDPEVMKPMREYKPRRRDGMCPRCGLQPRYLQPSGRRAAYCKPCMAEKWHDRKKNPC